MRGELALFGGERTASEPFPPWPRYSEKTLAEALAPLRSGRVGYWSGTRGRELESRWAAWVGARHAVACASGTAALHVALAALGIGPGDEIILPSHTFVSTALAVAHVGATPVFCDVGDDAVLDPRAVEHLVSARTRAILVVHLYGIMCAMDRIRDIARRCAAAVVEDCAQCVGGEYRGKKAGTLGDIGCFSFSQSKHISTGGEGGMVVTDDERLARACRSLCDYGREPPPVEPEAPRGAQGSAPLDEAAGPPRFRAITRLGFNYRLTEMQSIIGIHELERLDPWNLPRRKGFAKIYDHAFSQLYGVKSLPVNTAERSNAYWKYPLQLDLEKLACGGEDFRKALAAEGIPDCDGCPPECYQEPAFAKDGAARDCAPRPPAICPTAEALAARTVVLGLNPTWEKSHIELCIAAVKKVLRVYRR